MHANMTAVEKKSIFFHSFHPYFFSCKRKVSVFDLYSISRIKRTEYIPMLRAYARKQSKKSRNCQSGHLLNFLSKTKEILGKRAFVLLSPRRQGGCFDFYCFLTHSSSSLVRPLSLATCKCKDKLTTHYTSHYAPQFATPPYPFPSGMFSLVRKQIHGDCMYFGFVISLRSQMYILY